MPLCSICAGEIPPGANRCPRCGAPMAPGPERPEPAARWDATGRPEGDAWQPSRPESEGWQPGQPESEGWQPGRPEGWTPPPPMAPPPPGAAAVRYPAPVAASAPAGQRPPARQDWPGALRAAGLAVLAAYVLAAGLAVLLAPTGSPGTVLWVAAPSALVAVALGGYWQATVPALDEGVGGNTFGYQIHAFPLLLTGLLVLVLARAVRSRFETGRANDTLPDRLWQALRVAAALGGFGLVAGLLSRYAVAEGLVTHAGYVTAPVGGLLAGLAVAGVVATGYDVTQLPASLRRLWTALREPARMLRHLLLLATLLGTFGVLLALETAPANDLVVSGEDRRLLSGLAIASAPNLGWWLLATCLGVPVRVDLLSDERGTGVGSLLGGSAWWIPGIALAVTLLTAAAVRLLSGVPDPATARRRLILWTGLVALAALGFALFGVMRLAGGVGLFPVEYQVGSTSPLAVLLPPVWAALTGLAAYGITRRLPRPPPG